MACIALVDDEESLVESLRFLLEQQQYRVCSAATGPDALVVVEREQPDLVLLDVMLPGMDGFDVCRTLRQRGFAGTIVLLTARGEEIDQVLGLELGADDYVTKPFRHRELLARVKAHLRRGQRHEAEEQVVRLGELELRPERHEVFRLGQRVDLSPKEYQLLAYLIEHRRRAQTRERILETVWGYDFDGESRVVNVTIQRLRDKLEANPAEPRMIVTVRGVGYMFDV